jgi:hypothetical protein
MKYFIIAMCRDVVSYVYYCIIQMCSTFLYGSLDECVEYYWRVCGVYALWGLASYTIYVVLVEGGCIRFLVV